MGPFSVFTVFVVVIYVFGAVDKTSSSFSAHGKIGNFIIIIIFVCQFGLTYMTLYMIAIFSLEIVDSCSVVDFITVSCIFILL